MYTLKRLNVVKNVESEYDKQKLIQQGFEVVGDTPTNVTIVDNLEVLKGENEALKAEIEVLKSQIEALKPQTDGEENGQTGAVEETKTPTRGKK